MEPICIIELAWNLDRQGITIPGADASIATGALSAEADGMTFDTRFSHVNGLRAVAPPADWFL